MKRLNLEEMQKRLAELAAHQRAVSAAESGETEISSNIADSSANGNSRVFRDMPFAWWEKVATRKLRKKYKDDRRTFFNLRNTYLALCEIESDFVETPVRGLTNTVGKYSGLSRNIAGKCLKILEQEKFITRHRLINKDSKQYLPGTVFEINRIEAN